MDKLKPCCTTCEHIADFGGNYTECVLLHRFVDWYYWNSQTPADCPLLGILPIVEKEQKGR